MSTGLHIARATPEDAMLLAGLHRTCFDDAWNAESFRDILAHPKAFALLASAPGSSEVDGFVAIQTAASESEILTIGTVPGARRSGCARALVRAGAREAEAMGAEEMFLEVAVGNNAAFALYSGLGFTEAGRRRGYYRSAAGPVDALVLSARLPLPATQR